MTGEPLALILVAGINTLGLVLVAVIGLRTKRDTKELREQVQNSHETNLRDELDERHESNATILKRIARDLAAFRAEAREEFDRLWRRADSNRSRIEELEHTQPTPPRPRQRKPK